MAKPAAAKAATQRVDINLVLKIAQLARLTITKDEAERYRNDLDEILTAFDAIAKVKLAASDAPSFHPLPVRDVLRDDELEPSLSQAQALANTAHHEQGFFKGPRVV